MYSLIINRKSQTILILPFILLMNCSGPQALVLNKKQYIRFPESISQIVDSILLNYKKPALILYTIDSESDIFYYPITYDLEMINLKGKVSTKLRENLENSSHFYRDSLSLRIIPIITYDMQRFKIYAKYPVNVVGYTGHWPCHITFKLPDQIIEVECNNIE